MRSTSFFLLAILCLALTASAQITIYSEGPIDGNGDAFFITGPNNLDSNGDVQDISNGFVAANSGFPDTLEFGEWIVNGLTPSSISYELGTSAFGAEIGSGTVAQNAFTNHFLFTNGYGYDVFDVTISINPGYMTAGNEYWLSLSNANDPGNSGTEAWDVPNGGSGGPAICNYRWSGTNFGDCGFGGESFTLGACCGPVPEPSSILLFGSGILGIAGILRRKLNR
jgi:hypothetical protein